MKKHSKFFCMITICLALAMMIPVNAFAAEKENAGTYASDYLSSYTAYTVCPGNNVIEVYFSVTGTRTMDCIGALTIYLQESTDRETWTTVKSFTTTTNPEMLAYNTVYHSGCMRYTGTNTSGKYYRARVTIRAEKGGDGDSRYILTSVKLAS